MIARQLVHNNMLMSWFMAIRGRFRSAKAWNVELKQERDDLAISREMSIAFITCLAQTVTVFHWGQFHIQINEIDIYSYSCSSLNQIIVPLGFRNTLL
jgi:hypothetical protein